MNPFHFLEIAQWTVFVSFLLLQNATTLNYYTTSSCRGQARPQQGASPHYPILMLSIHFYSVLYQYESRIYLKMKFKTGTLFIGADS